LIILIIFGEEYMLWTKIDRSNKWYALPCFAFLCVCENLCLFCLFFVLNLYWLLGCWVSM
jgi:hypothetical protein